ncbi:AAA family ATPase [Inquilinus limosus]|uniref:adenylate/guanylate cyclase domain-containing protein n=1 Tax=Inquilinus limosus TaxID=171674 RepID=UPI003F137972
MDVGVWLRELGLGQYEQLFRDNAIDAEILSELTDSDLEGLGVLLGHRKKLLKAIAALREAAMPPGTAAAAPMMQATATAERRQLTVMFIDLVGSTALSARLDPEVMREVMRAYQNAAVDELVRFDGHVAKFMGDGIVAYFGWPKAHEDEAERAVRAALRILDAVGRLATPSGEALAARIGIATGVVVVGDLIGEGAAQEEAVIGETPNLAARLQSLAAPDEVIISDGTRRLLGGLFEFEDLGEQSLKGLATPVRAFRVLGPGQSESRFEAFHGRGPEPLVGRTAELSLLLDRWQRARAGEGQVVFLSGEPGIGKSRIVLALRERLAEEPFTPLSHFCSPYRMNSALFPVIGLLERAAGFGRNDTSDEKLAKIRNLLAPYTRDVEEAAALVAEMLSLPVDGLPDLSPERQKQRTFEILLEQFQGLCRQQPVLAVYEDAHWIDPSTAEFLGLIIERTQHLRALVVVTFRPEFNPPWTGHAHVTSLSLSRLVRADVVAMVNRLTDGKALPTDVLKQISDKTDGVPLFIEELTKAVLESGLLRDAGDHFELNGILPAMAIPSTLQDSLMARLDRLAPVKELAQVASCIGREFDHDLLAAVSPLQGAALDDGLARLIQSDLVIRRGLPPHATYVFKHALIQDAAYATLLRSRRALIHGQIAAALEARFPELVDRQPELLARHLTEAGLTEKAADWWLRAGQLASARSAYKEAIAHLTKALAMIETLAPTEERFRRELEVQSALCPPLIATKGFAAPEVGDACARAERLARQLGRQDHLAVALRGLCYVVHVRGDLRRTRELGAELLGLEEQSDDPVLQADAHNASAFTLFHLGEHASARDHLETARSKIEAVGDPARAFSRGVNIYIFGRAYAAHVEWHLGYPDRALSIGREMVGFAQQLDHPFSLAVALNYAAMLHQFRREPSETRDLANAALAVCTEYEFAYYRAWATVLLGWATAEQGDLEQGILGIQDGVQDLRNTGAGLRLPYYLCLLAGLYHQARRDGEASRTLSEAMDIVERNDEHWVDANLHLLRSTLLAADQPEAAVDCCRRAIEIARGQGARPLVLRATAQLVRLSADPQSRVWAYDQLAQAHGWFTEGFDTPDLQEARTLLDAGP